MIETFVSVSIESDVRRYSVSCARALLQADKPAQCGVNASSAEPLSRPPSPPAVCVAPMAPCACNAGPPGLRCPLSFQICLQRYRLCSFFPAALDLFVLSWVRVACARSPPTAHSFRWVSVLLLPENWIPVVKEFPVPAERQTYKHPITLQFGK